MIDQDTLSRLGNNPERGIPLVINEIENAWFDGLKQLNSKTHPAILAIDLIIGTAHGFHNQLADTCSQLFKEHARNLDDLSRHMSDQERYGMFANPSSSVFRFGLSTEVFLANASLYQETIGTITSDYLKLVIPKDTQISVGGYYFSIENGIEIRYNERTGYQVVYDSKTNNPFNPISNNLLTRSFKIVGNRRYLVIDIPVRQIKMTPLENIASSQGAGCNGDFDYTDYLYGVRAILVDETGTSKEIKVTYNQAVFNPSEVTLVLGIDPKTKVVKYEIPDVYIVNGTGLGTLRIYVYTTVGALEKDFTATSSTDFSPVFLDIRYGSNNLNQYSSPLNNMGGYAFSCLTPVSGGSDPIPFETFKQTVIENRNNRNTPITEKNLQGEVERYGYSPVKAIEYVTGRTYSLTKELPVQDNKKFKSAMGCFVGSHLTSVKDLVNSGLVYKNGDRYTLPHNVLFNVDDPTVVLVSQTQKNAYMGLSAEAKVELVNNNNFTYTPFYHVFDLTNKQAALRTYHLDGPAFNYQTFISENTSLGIEVGIGQINIVHKDDGYLVTVVTASGKSYQQLDDAKLGVQMSFTPSDGSSLASVAGVYKGKTTDGERIWEFKLNSRFDLDSSDVLYFDGLRQFNIAGIGIGTPLVNDLEFIFAVQGDNSNQASDTDKKIQQSLFDETMIGIIETHYNVRFGKRLDNLYSRIRPIVGPAQYKRYQEAVPAVWEATTYKRDANNNLIVTNGKLVVEHKAGDIKKSSDGKIIYAFNKNDVVYENGKPVVLDPEDIKYHWDFISFDGAYFFTNDDFDIDFAQKTKNYFINVIVADMEAFGSSALDRTVLYFQPRSKIGYQKVFVNDSRADLIKQDLSFTVTYYLTDAGMRNSNLQQSIKDTTAGIINGLLYNKNTIGNSDLVKALKDNASSSDVVDVKVSSLAGDLNIDVISSADSLTGFSVGKGLSVGSNGLISVREKIDVMFLNHSTSS